MPINSIKFFFYIFLTCSRYWINTYLVIFVQIVNKLKIDPPYCPALFLLVLLAQSWGWSQIIILEPERSRNHNAKYFMYVMCLRLRWLQLQLFVLVQHRRIFKNGTNCNSFLLYPLQIYSSFNHKILDLA
jgi:hypothetical protein